MSGIKINRTHVFIVLSSAALIALLFIQVNWILKTARVKEQLFSEKANMVLSKTTEALHTDEQTFEQVQACVDDNPVPGSATTLGEDEKETIDSLFNYYMRYYNFYIDYTYEVVKPIATVGNNEKGFASYIYNQPVYNANTPDRVELKLIFPKKREFIMAEMGPMFITSVVLILVVLFMFWRTLLSFMKEKKIAEHTRDFLNNMTHEFKTPLTNISLAGKMMLKDLHIQQEEKVKHYSGIILEENEKLKLQVEHMLGMTALERGELPLHKTVFDMHTLVNDAVKGIGLQVENLQGLIHTELTAEHSLVQADKTHVLHALNNLLDNAIKYSEDKPDITIRTYNMGNKLVVEVSDRGMGIEKQYQKKVFDKFFRVPTGNVHNVKGFGLGLAYIKKIVELHGADIILDSGKGKGTTFRLIFKHA